MALHCFSSLLPRKWWLLLAALSAVLALALLLHPEPLAQLSVDLVPDPNGGTVVKLAFSTCSGAPRTH
jgi:hypothetical protein